MRALFPFGRENFYPRPPRGGRPHVVGGLAFCDEISIHALREEGDAIWRAAGGGLDDFYPRPPRGGRPASAALPASPVIFLSTPSARRATLRPDFELLRHLDFYPRPPRGGRRTRNYGCDGPGAISIHALREEGDHSTAAAPGCPGYFYPRPPRGGRHALVVGALCVRQFLSTPSARRATGILSEKTTETEKFLSTPSARRATRICPRCSMTL